MKENEIGKMALDLAAQVRRGAEKKKTGRQERSPGQ
jgi:hypothetical protein